MQSAPPPKPPDRDDKPANECLKNSADSQLAPKPTLWRIIRAYLNVREMAKAQYIFEYVKMHKPLTTRQDFDEKLRLMLKRNDIKRVKYGVYAITQQGKKDLIGPDGANIAQDEPQAAQETGTGPSSDGLQPTFVRSNSTKPPYPAPKGCSWGAGADMEGSFWQLFEVDNDPDERVAKKQTDPAVTPVHLTVNGQDVIVNLKIRVSVEVV